MTWRLDKLFTDGKISVEEYVERAKGGVSSQLSYRITSASTPFFLRESLCQSSPCFVKAFKTLIFLSLFSIWVVET